MLRIAVRRKSCRACAGTAGRRAGRRPGLIEPLDRLRRRHDGRVRQVLLERPRRPFATIRKNTRGQSWPRSLQRPARPRPASRRRRVVPRSAGRCAAPRPSASSASSRSSFRHEVDMPPFPRQDFAVDAPAGDVGHGGDALERHGQMPAHGQETVMLEKPLTDIPFLQHRNVRPIEELPGLDGEREHALEDGELAVDRPIGGLGLPPLRDVGIDLGGARSP